MGFPLDRSRIRQLAFKFAKKLGIDHRFNQETKMAGFPWLRSFLRRNPDVSIRKSEGLSMARAKGLSRKAVGYFYDLLDSEIQKYGLRNKPQNFFNCDESGLQLINSTGQVFTAKGTKAVNQLTTGERGETVTVLACCSAEGRFMPPTVILKGKNKKPEFEDGLPPGAVIYMNQKSAYINAELFLRWFKEEFLPRKAPGRNILILDGHGSHCSSIELLETAEANDVSLICLPPHTTHALQPLDRAFFAPLKVHFKAAAGTWVQQHIGRRLNRYQLGPLLNTAWSKAASVGNGTSGFSATGIYPFNRNALPDHYFAISDTMETEDASYTDEDTPLAVRLTNFGNRSEEESESKVESPTSVLKNINPMPGLSGLKTKSRRPDGKATLLTSRVNRLQLQKKIKEKKKLMVKKKA